MCKNKDVIDKIEYLSNCMLAYCGIGVWDLCMHYPCVS